MPPKPNPARRYRQRETHPQWKGGRTITSSGYVTVLVGFDHPLANANGYAYEHRVVAEQKIGRRLLPGEVVHHVNHDRQDNRPENLEVLSGNPEHSVKHRTVNLNLRMPGEDNPIVQCACGCGETLPRFDEQGRPRDYIRGHNSHPSPVEDRIIASLSTRSLTTSEMTASTGIPAKRLSVHLSRLVRKRAIVRIRLGLYSLPPAGDPHEE